MNGPVFFFVREREGIFCFFPYTHCVPIKFPKNSQNVPKCIPQEVPNSTQVLFCMVCSKFNSHLSKTAKTEKVKSRGTHLLLFCNWGPKRHCTSDKMWIQFISTTCLNKKKKPMQTSETCSKSNNYILNATHPPHLDLRFKKEKCILEFYSQTNNILNPNLGSKKTTF